MISVIIPVFNVEKYLDKCMESVLTNTYRDLEVICVNDGSTDRCPEIHGKFADSEDSFLYCFCQINPRKENIEISAKFEVLDMDDIPDNQTGFGILAADTVFSEGNDGSGSTTRHRNHLLLGRFRTADGREVYILSVIEYNYPKRKR